MSTGLLSTRGTDSGCVSQRTGTRRRRPLLCWLAGALALLPMVGLGAAGPPEAPLLRLETGSHTVTITRIASDRAGRWIVSASLDKTLRLWDAADGRLLRVFRPPIGADNEGKLFAVAIDPDGDWIAAGGWDWDGSIYLLDRASGRLRQRIDGLGNAILHLCVSPDGRRLAAVLGGGQGLRVYAADTGFTEVFADRDYDDDSYGCAFAADGRLVTTSLDGRLRLYAPDGVGLHRQAVRKTTLGQQPYEVAFHPDGTRIAVGFDDSTAVQVLDGRDLTPQFAADTAGLDNGSLSTVAWSRDGRRLLAGGRYDDGSGNNPVLSWDAAGQGRRQVWRATDNTVVDLAPLPDGRVAVGTFDPALLLLDASGQALWRRSPVIADMRSNFGEAFRVSTDGQQVAFGLGYGSQDPVWFDLSERRLHLGSPATSEPLRIPRTRAPELDVQGWDDTTEPTLNGESLKLKIGEIARSLAIAPDGQQLLLGTEWSLRLFDRDGKELWRKPVPGIAWGVNISADGRLALAAFGDGTLRWYRLSDGEELLALFVLNRSQSDAGAAAAGTDWVLWTPSGYYDASPGSDRLIGWHLNQGKDQVADFMPASQLRERFYRPEVIDAVLTTLDEDQAIARAGIREKIAVADALPPTLRLLDPVDGALFTQPKLTLRYRADSHSDAPITQLQVLVDGRPLAGVRGLARIQPEGARPGASGGHDDSARTDSLDVVLPQRDLELGLIAENRHGASPVATARLHWGGSGTAEFIAKPTLYLLAIGVSDYADDSLDLRFPAKDAADLVAAFQRQSGRLYERVTPRLLADAKADAILDGLDWLRREVTAKDLGVLYLAGHGVNDDDGDYYFLPTDVDTERLRRSAVPYYEIKKTLSALSGKTLAFVDTCHAGNVMGARRGVADITRVINDLSAAENGVVVFASSSGRQYALEDPAWGNGAFTKALVEGLTGKADYTQDGTITINQLDLYLSERVKTLTDNRQTPTTTKPQTIADFPIATSE